MTETAVAAPPAPSRWLYVLQLEEAIRQLDRVLTHPPISQEAGEEKLDPWVGILVLVLRAKKP